MKWDGLDYSHCSWERFSLQLGAQHLLEFEARNAAAEAAADTPSPRTTGKQKKQQQKKKAAQKGAKQSDFVELKEQPASMSAAGSLYSFQLEALNWIRFSRSKGNNVILADEMGLGKTIQAIGLISSLYERGVSGPFLVVVPLSTLSNWNREFNRFTPTIPTVLFHGSKPERPKLYKEVRLKEMSVRGRTTKVFPVVMTSYEMIKLEHKFFQRFSWSFLIVDEGHRLKNLNCQLIKQLKALQSDNRLLLTGTPLQNNIFFNKLKKKVRVFISTQQNKILISLMSFFLF